MPGTTTWLRDAAEDSFGLPKMAAAKSGGSVMAYLSFTRFSSRSGPSERPLRHQPLP